MAGGKLTVRQKMINMMYLVLTALLALNVSAEILKAFHMVEVSMDRAGTNIDKKNEITVKGINAYHKNFPDDPLGTDIFNKAVKADKIAVEGVKYIQELKLSLIEAAGGREEGNPEAQVAQPSNIELHANLMINQGKGADVKKKIDQIRTDLIGLLPKDKQTLVKSDLNTDPPKNKAQTWESEMFEHTPLAAVIALLSKTQNDIKNTEAQVLDILKSMISEDVILIDKLEPKVIPNNGTYITLGSEYSADIFLAASSSKQEASILVNGSAVKVEGGIGKYSVVPNREGEIEYKGTITTTKSNGKKESYEFKSSFTALKPLAVVSATKMNVVYRGIANPISISVPGYSATEIIANVSAGSLGKAGQPGTYNLNIPVNDATRELVINVSVKDKTTDKVKKMGEQRYRVKNIPKPTPRLGAIDASGPWSAGILKGAAFVYAELKDFAFEGLTFTPISYAILYAPRKGDATVFMGNGQTVTPQMRGAFNNARTGDRFVLGQMKAQGPAGAVQVPAALAIEVK